MTSLWRHKVWVNFCENLQNCAFIELSFILGIDLISMHTVVDTGLNFQKTVPENRKYCSFIKPAASEFNVFQTLFRTIFQSPNLDKYSRYIKYRTTVCKIRLWSFAWTGQKIKHPFLWRHYDVTKCGKIFDEIGIILSN